MALRRIVRWGAGVLVLLGVLVVAALLFTQTPMFRNWLRGVAETQASAQLTDAEVTIGRVEGNLFTGAQLSDVTVRQNGRDVIVVEHVSAKYNIRRLLGNALAFSSITLEHPVIALVHSADGWQPTRLLRRNTRDPDSMRTFAIDALTIDDGTIVIEEETPVSDKAPLPKRVTSLDAVLGLIVEGGGLDLDVHEATFVTEQPELDVRSLTGRFITEDAGLHFDDFHIRTARSELDVAGAFLDAGIRATVKAAPLDLDEFAAYLPDWAGMGLRPSFDVGVGGPLDALDVAGTLTEPRIGEVRSQLVVNARADVPTARGTVNVARLNLAPLLESGSPVTDLTARADVDMRFPGGGSPESVTIDATVHSTQSAFAGYRYDALDGTIRLAGREVLVAVTTRAYGASARAEGTIATRAPLAYDLHGTVRGVDLRRLPPQLRVQSLESDITGAYTVTGVNARLEGTLAFAGSEVEGAAIANGSEGRIDLTGDVPTYAFAGHVAGLDVSRLGRALEMPVFETYGSSAITGRIELAGSGRDLAGTRLDATVMLEASTFAGAAVDAAALQIQIADRQLTASGTGTFASFDPARVTGREDLEGDLAGRFNLRTTVAQLGEPITVDSITAEGSVTFVGSRLGSVRIESADIEGRYANRMGELTTLRVTGPGISATASGAVSLADTGASDLTYHIAHDRLEEIGRLFGRDIGGRIVLDGTLTGNGARLVSTGTASVGSPRVGTAVEALDAHASYTVSLDDLRLETLSLTADVESTLMTAFGRSIRSATAMVTYADSALTFDTTLNEVERSVTAAGELRFLPDAREVRVEQLRVQAAQQTWTTASGPFVASFGNAGLVTLTPVTLASGNQRATADGSISLVPGVNGSMNFTLEQADLTELGAILLVPRELGGVLQASGQMTGDSAHRLFTGTGTVTNGLVDGFRFESLDAALDYDGGRIDVDATLVQAPGSQLTAKGRVATVGGSLVSNEPMDLQITTTGIDLGLLGAATTAFESVSGVLVADVHVGGTAASPRFDGSVNVDQGAFALAATGAVYQGVVLDATLQGDQLRVNRLHVLDDKGQPLDGSGTLSIERRQVQNIDLTLQADDFEVLANRLGQMSVNATLNVFGTLLSPTIAGLVRVRSGLLEVDALVERFTTSAYAIPQPSLPEGVPVAETTGITFDVSVQVPDNLVLRGTDIRPGDSTVALGSMNIIVGGDFSVKKNPGADAVLFGTMTTVRGNYDYQGRRFSVLRDGIIAFRSERPIDPALALQAERVISGIVAHVNIDGTMRMPQISLSSPSGVDESDLLSLIVFNQPVNRLASNQLEVLGTRAVGLASGFVVSPIADSLAHALDVDLFEIESVTDDGSGPAITVGEQVGERLFLKVRQAFGAQNTSEFQLEYQLADFLRLQGSVAEGRTRANRSLTRRVERAGIDLVVFFSF